MDDRIRLALFVTALFIAILITDLLDKSLRWLTQQNDWWNLAVGMPLLLVTIGTGFLTERIKPLIKFAFFGAICFFIVLATQIYFLPEENKTEWEMLQKKPSEIFEYFGVIFFGLFVMILFLIVFGRILRYIYNLFFVKSKAEFVEE